STAAAPPMTLAAIAGLGVDTLPQDGQPISFVASVHFITNSRLMWYNACVGCNKKVQLAQGEPYCQNCNKQTQVIQKYIMRVEMVDHSGTLYINLFDKAAKQLLGKSAAELKEMNADAEGEDTIGQTLNEFLQNKLFMERDCFGFCR
ncbi:hypothetical protein KIPB_015163, partial [Kipferlia bialata]